MEKNKLNIIVRKINGEIKDIQQQLEDSYGRFDSYYKNINNLLEKNKGQMELEKSIKTRFKNFFIDYVDKVQGLNLKLTTKNELKKSILIENPDVENDLRKQELIKSILLINKKIKENPQEFPKEYITKIKKDVPFDICYTIEENVWQEKRTIQLNIKGIRFEEI